MSKYDLFNILTVPRLTNINWPYMEHKVYLENFKKKSPCKMQKIRNPRDKKQKIEYLWNGLIDFLQIKSILFLRVGLIKQDSKGIYVLRN